MNTDQGIRESREEQAALAMLAERGIAQGFTMSRPVLRPTETIERLDIGRFASLEALDTSYPRERRGIESVYELQTLPATTARDGLVVISDMMTAWYTDRFSDEANYYKREIAMRTYLCDTFAGAAIKLFDNEIYELREEPSREHYFPSHIVEHVGRKKNGNVEVDLVKLRYVDYPSDGPEFRFEGGYPYLRSIPLSVVAPQLEFSDASDPRWLAVGTEQWLSIIGNLERKLKETWGTELERKHLTYCVSTKPHMVEVPRQGVHEIDY